MKTHMVELVSGMLGMLKKLTSQRKWAVPLGVATLFVVLGQCGIRVDPQLFWGTVTLVLGATVAEGAKDMAALLGKLPPKKKEGEGDEKEAA